MSTSELLRYKVFKIPGMLDFTLQRRCFICTKVQRVAMLVFSSNISKHYIATRSYGVCCLFFFLRFFMAGRGPTWRKDEPPPWAGLSRCSKGASCSSSPSCGRAHLGHLGVPKVGLDVNILWSWRFSLWYGGGADDYRSVCCAVVA